MQNRRKARHIMIPAERQRRASVYSPEPRPTCGSHQHSAGRTAPPRFRILTGPTPDVCLRYSKFLEVSILSARLHLRDASTALPRPFISCSGPQSAGQKVHSIPIAHGPAPSKSAYRKCSGERHSATPNDFCAGAFPIKPKDLSFPIGARHSWDSPSPVIPDLSDFRGWSDVGCFGIRGIVPLERAEWMFL